MARNRSIVSREQLIDWLVDRRPELLEGVCVEDVRIEQPNTSYLRLSGFLNAKASVQYHPYQDESSQPIVFQRAIDGNAFRVKTKIPTLTKGRLLTYGIPDIKKDDGTKQVRFDAALIWSDDDGNEFINAEITDNGKVVGAGYGVLACHAWTGTVLNRRRSGNKRLVEFEGFSFRD